jgi:hypothetical protein
MGSFGLYYCLVPFFLAVCGILPIFILKKIILKRIGPTMAIFVPRFFVITEVFALIFILFLFSALFLVPPPNDHIIAHYILLISPQVLFGLKIVQRIFRTPVIIYTNDHNLIFYYFYTGEMIRAKKRDILSIQKSFFRTEVILSKSKIMTCTYFTNSEKQFDIFNPLNVADILY